MSQNIIELEIQLDSLKNENLLLKDNHIAEKIEEDDSINEQLKESFPQNKGLKQVKSEAVFIQRGEVQEEKSIEERPTENLNFTKKEETEVTNDIKALKTELSESEQKSMEGTNQTIPKTNFDFPFAEKKSNDDDNSDESENLEEDENIYEIKDKKIEEVQDESDSKGTISSEEELPKKTEQSNSSTEKNPKESSRDTPVDKTEEESEDEGEEELSYPNSTERRNEQAHRHDPLTSSQFQQEEDIVKEKITLPKEDQFKFKGTVSLNFLEEFAVFGFTEKEINSLYNRPVIDTLRLRPHFVFSYPKEKKSELTERMGNFMAAKEEIKTFSSFKANFQNFKKLFDDQNRINDRLFYLASRSPLTDANFDHTLAIDEESAKILSSYNSNRYFYYFCMDVGTFIIKNPDSVGEISYVEVPKIICLKSLLPCKEFYFSVLTSIYGKHFLKRNYK